MPIPETQESLLELLRASTDEWGWLQPLLDDPESAAVLLSTVEVWARLGAAVVHNRDALTISSSSAGQLGTSSLTMVREGTATSGTIPKGYPFVDQRGVIAIAQAAVHASVGQTTVVVPVQTVRTTELVNTDDDPGFSVYPRVNGVIGDLAITNIIGPPGDLANGLSTFTTVASATPIVGGAADYLSVHGSERGVFRQPEESEADYRARVRNIPDAVSPIAVADVVQAVVQQRDLPPFLLKEPFADGATPALKDLHGLGEISWLALDADDGDVGDYIDDAYGGELLDRRTARAYASAEAQSYVKDTSSGAVYLDDDGYADDEVLGYPADVDIFPPAVLSGLLALYQSAKAKVAGGVQIDVLLRPPDLLVAQGSTSSTVYGSPAWVIAPDAGHYWLVWATEVGHDTAIPVAAAEHYVEFVLHDGTTYTSAKYSGTDTERIPPMHLPVAVIRGWAKTDGVTPVNLVANVRVLDLWPPLP